MSHCGTVRRETASSSRMGGAFRRRPEPAVTLATAPRSSRFEPAWLAAEYNQRARHPEHVEIGARWHTASSLVQRLESWRRDVRYGPSEDS